MHFLRITGLKLYLQRKSHLIVFTSATALQNFKLVSPKERRY